MSLDFAAAFLRRFAWIFGDFQPAGGARRKGCSGILLLAELPGEGRAAGMTQGGRFGRVCAPGRADSPQVKPVRRRKANRLSQPREGGRKGENLGDVKGLCWVAPSRERADFHGSVPRGDAWPVLLLNYLPVRITRAPVKSGEQARGDAGELQ